MADNAAQLIDRYRAREPVVDLDVVLQINHPRGIHFRPERRRLAKAPGCGEG